MLFDAERKKTKHNEKFILYCMPEQMFNFTQAQVLIH